MKPYYQDNHIRIFCKDCRSMEELGDESVQMCVTSPPYWGLRKYSGEQELIWGGDCPHEWGSLIPNPMSKSGKHGPASILTKTADEQHAVRKESNQGSYCQLCSAWRGSYGLEPQPDCGRPFVKLRSDLTEKELDYAKGELERCGLL